MDQFYNPATADCFGAKVWECLRRNPAFLECINDIETKPDDESRRLQADYYANFASENSNAYAEHVFRAMNYGTPWDVKLPWSEQKQECRDGFPILPCPLPYVVTEPSSEKAIKAFETFGEGQR